ncbi:MAG: nucleotidyltransferase domain-containing protein, partial [Alphaproteobacteria bacterium]|nr:nucleotidyltransferase domain-containing protein [Alphaproteobacteria bacterium]
MHADIEKRPPGPELAALCRRFDVARLEVFGSAARGTDFDLEKSDIDFLVTLGPGTRANFAAFLDFREALVALLGRSV